MDEHLYAQSLKFLTRRPRSEKEMRDFLYKKINKLLSKLNSQSALVSEKIEEIISRLKEQKFINDLEFAKWWIQQRVRFRPKGWRALEFELKQKGISAQIIKRLKIDNEMEMARELISKRMKKYQGLTVKEIYSKLGGFLARRGFDFQTIKTCIDEVLGK